MSNEVVVYKGKCLVVFLTLYMFLKGAELLLQKTQTNSVKQLVGGRGGRDLRGETVAATITLHWKFSRGCVCDCL